MGGAWRHAGGQAGGLVQHQHGGLEHDRPRPDVDRAGHSEAVTALEVAHRAPRLRAKDSVHRQMRQRDDLVQAPLSRRHQSSLPAQLKHHPLTISLQQAISPGVSAAGRERSRSRLRRPDYPRKHRSGGERRAQRQRHAPLPAPSGTSQLGEPATLARPSQRTLP